MWLTLLFLTVPLGIVVGYVVTAVMLFSISWKWAFMVELALMIGPLAILFFTVPSKYYDTANHRDEDDDEEEEENEHIQDQQESML